LRSSPARTSQIAPRIARIPASRSPFCISASARLSCRLTIPASKLERFPPGSVNRSTCSVAEPNSSSEISVTALSVLVVDAAGVATRELVWQPEHTIAIATHLVRRERNIPTSLHARDNIAASEVPMQRLPLRSQVQIIENRHGRPAGRSVSRASSFLLVFCSRKLRFAPESGARGCSASLHARQLHRSAALFTTMQHCRPNASEGPT